MAETHCIDCGIPTQPGRGSVRCPACWEDRCGIDKHKDFIEQLMTQTQENSEICKLL